MSPKDSPTFCSLGWNHQFIGTGGLVKPCCRYAGKHVPETHNLRDHTLEEVFNDEFMTNLRESFTYGDRDPGCMKCWQEEDAGKRLSIRQNYNRNIIPLNELHHDMDTSDPTIRWLELSFNNRCNVRCRMCGPNFSTNWYKDWELVKKYVPTPYDFQRNVDNVEDYIRINPEPKTIDLSKLDSILPNIRHLKLTGGEPFIMPEYRMILERLVEIGQAKNVFLNYSTNLTIMPKQSDLDLWKHFKYIEFATSLDGIGDVLEYQRFPSKWDTVHKVLKSLFYLRKDMNVKVGTRPTITVYNILDVPNITHYWSELEGGLTEDSWINHTHCALPDFLSITILPEHLKKLVKERLDNTDAITKRQRQSWNHLVAYMYSKDDSHLLPEFKDFTLKLDQARGEDMAKVIPEFAELVK